MVKERPHKHHNSVAGLGNGTSTEPPHPVVKPLVFRALLVLLIALIYSLSIWFGSNSSDHNQTEQASDGQEIITNDPSSLSDEYLKDVLDRLLTNRMRQSDWQYVDEAIKTGLDLPSTYENPGHHDPSRLGANPYDPTKSVLPENHKWLWKQSVEASDGNRWAKEGKGKKTVYHRFQNDGNGNWHWNGSTAGQTKSGKERSIKINNVPNEIKKL